jgi:hypothetical protein
MRLLNATKESPLDEWHGDWEYDLYISMEYGIVWS